MSFSCPIKLFRPYGSLEAVRVEVPLTVLSAHAPEPHAFIFDTGCEITMVSEDVVTELGLPAVVPW